MKRRRVLVCGAGSIGRRHIANLLTLGAEVSVWRARVDRLAELKAEFAVTVHSNLDAAIDAVEAVVVATATDQHLPIASAALRAGRALFLEKPVSHGWEGMDALLALPRTIVEVGCQLRAHPNLIALAKTLATNTHAAPFSYRFVMGQRLDQWRPDRDYREGYSVDATRGGGALFDLIHQIDLALWLLGPIKSVRAVLAKVGPLEIRADDIAHLLITHANGVTGHVQLDMVAPVHRCEAEVMTERAVLQWSNREGTLVCRTADGVEVLDRTPPEFTRNDLFLNHMSHFLRRMDNASLAPMCSMEDGASALRVALAARHASKTGCAVEIDR